jgi:TonB family protein
MKPHSVTHRRRIALASLAVALLFIMISARETAVDVFFQHAELLPDTTASPADSLSPSSIIAFHVDPETNTTGLIDLTPPPPPPPSPPPPAPVAPDTATVRPEEPAPSTPADVDIGDLLEEDAGPHSSPAPTAVAAVPPRPIEITWPETRKLKQCIGASVTVRIWVSEEGKVKDAQVVPAGVLPACADAALVAARHIRFEPGRQGGIPITMWTEVRIDFQQRN